MFWSDQGGAFFWRNLSSVSSWISQNHVFEKRRPKRLALFPGGFRYHNPLHSCRWLSVLPLSCVCPEIVIRVDKYSAFHLFGQLLDGFLELGFVKRSVIEAAKTEFQSVVCAQRQVEKSVNRWRSPINNLFSFGGNHPGFRSCRNLKKISISLRFAIR